MRCFKIITMYYILTQNNICALQILSYCKMNVISALVFDLEVQLRSADTNQRKIYSLTSLLVIKCVLMVGPLHSSVKTGYVPNIYKYFVFFCLHYNFFTQCKNDGHISQTQNMLQPRNICSSMMQLCSMRGKLHAQKTPRVDVT